MRKSGRVWARGGLGAAGEKKGVLRLTLVVLPSVPLAVSGLSPVPPPPPPNQFCGRAGVASPAHLRGHGREPALEPGARGDGQDVDAAVQPENHPARLCARALPRPQRALRVAQGDDAGGGHCLGQQMVRSPRKDGRRQRQHGRHLQGAAGMEAIGGSGGRAAGGVAGNWRRDGESRRRRRLSAEKGTARGRESAAPRRRTVA